MKYLRLELKVCEGCGAIWLRREFENIIYCTTCTTRLASFPPSRGKRGGGRPRTSTSARSLRRCTGQHRTKDGAL